ncbi:MAG: glycosyltransferase, partial [Rhodocyclaceae bacterium]|nr:glycosyltransferase [Rhodocyclaceae bacterium]
VDIEGARAACELAICHGGHGTTAAMLLAGKPLLLLPMHSEQGMTAHRLETLGVALSALPEAAAQLQRLLKRALAEPRPGETARAFAARHHAYDQAAAIAHAADRCESMLEAH